MSDDEDDKEELVAHDVDEAINVAGFGKFQIIMIFIVGSYYLMEIFQVQLLVIMGNRLQCEWRLSESQRATLSTVGFAGFLVGDLVFGPLSDRIGRRDSLRLGGVMVILYSCLSAIAPNYFWFVLLQSLNCFWIGGLVPSLVSYGVELTPSKWRGAVWYLVLALNGSGSLVGQLLAWSLLYRVDHDWRFLLLCYAALYSIITLSTFIFIPRSPRFCLINGRSQEAADIIDQVAAWNGAKRRPHLKLKVSHVHSGESGNLLVLLNPKLLLKGTLLMVLLMMCAGFTYFSVLELAIQIPLVQQHHCSLLAEFVNSTSQLPKDCAICDRINFSELLLPSLADPFGCIMTVLILEPLLKSRKTALVGSFIATACCMPIMAICASQPILTAIFFCSRAISSSTYSTVQLQASEYFPTSVRSTAMAVAFGSVRVCMVATPLLTQIFVPQVSILIGCCLLAGICLTAALAALLLLKRETKGRAVEQTVDEWLASDPSFSQQRLNEGQGIKMKENYGSLSEN